MIWPMRGLRAQLLGLALSDLLGRTLGRGQSALAMEPDAVLSDMSMLEPFVRRPLRVALMTSTGAPTVAP